MNKEEYESLELTDAEIAAVQRYIGYSHTSMNTLLDLDPKVMSTLSKKGWELFLDGNSIKDNIESLSTLYSAMYKYSRARGGAKSRAYRGTTPDEIAKLQSEKISGKFLSTSRDEDIAMRFTQYGNGAMLDLNIASDIPYINMDDFLDENTASEAEILIAPFAKVGGVKEKYTRENVTWYYAEVSKPEFKNITEAERKEHMETVLGMDFETELDRYESLANEIDILESRIQRMGTPTSKDEREELAYYREKQSKLLEEFSEVSGKFMRVKTSMNAVLQDRFKTIELEVEKSLEQEEQKKAEEKRLSKIDASRDIQESLLKLADETLGKTEISRLNYSNLDSEEQELMDKASELGIDIPGMHSVDQETLAKFEELKQNIENIKLEIATIEIPDTLTEEELSVSGELNKKLNALYDKLSITTKVLAECEKTIFDQKSRNKQKLSNMIGTKVSQDISARLQEDLAKKERELERRKDSFLDKITGKSKIKAAQMENLRLRREYIKRGGLRIPEGLDDVRVYAAKCKLILGEEALPDSANAILEGKRITASITDSEIDSFNSVRPENSLVPTGKSTREILAALNVENERLTERTGLIAPMPSQKTDMNLEENVKNSVERCLDAAIFYTAELTEEQRENLVSRQITWG